MTIERLAIPDLVMITPRRFTDGRGWFAESFNAQAFAAIDASVFVQDNEALSSAAWTVRGLHFQRPPAAQGKLVRVTRGAVFDVALDIRRGSPSFGRSVAARLDAATGAQLFIPPGFAHGYCTLEPDTVVAYKVTDHYSPADEAGVLWSDPALGIAWPVAAADAVLSEKDQRLPLLAALATPFAMPA